MISRLISDLETALEEDMDNCVSGFSQDIKIEMHKIDPNQNFLSIAQNLPCINPECKFLKYQKIFYPRMKFFMLPAKSKSYFCVVCDGIDKGTLKRSQIQILNNMSIILQK